MLRPRRSEISNSHYPVAIEKKRSCSSLLDAAPRASPPRRAGLRRLALAYVVDERCLSS